jgi:hypothetical protein
MFEYVLVVYAISMDNPEYIGHFSSCAVANDYVKEHYPKAHYTTCLFEDYIRLPEGLIKKEIK